MNASMHACMQMILNLNKSTIIKRVIDIDMELDAHDLISFGT